MPTIDHSMKGKWPQIKYKHLYSDVKKEKLS